MAKNICKKYNQKNVLFDINLKIEAGKVLFILGSNGSGKSTLMKILSTLIEPTSGEYTVDCLNILKEPNIFRKHLGYLPQDVPIYPKLTAIEFLEYISALKGCNHKESKEQINFLLNIFNLSNYRDIKLYKYSGGMKRKIGICSALLGDPKILILDEPTAGLDIEERWNVIKSIKELSENKILILTSHIMSDVKYLSDEIMIINEGSRVFYDTIKNFKHCFGSDLEEGYINFVEEIRQNE